MNGKEALSIIKEIGVDRLGGFDGCICTSFEVQGVEVHLGCRKGSGGYIGRQIKDDFYGTIVRVTSRHMDRDDAALAEIAEEVRRQLTDITHEEIMVRFCDYRHDKEGICDYCNEPRAERWGYYCSKHLLPESRGWL